MNIRQFYVYLADLEPPFGSEPGKIRPVVVVQTDLLNEAGHHSTIVCPLTTQLTQDTFPLRIRLEKEGVGLKQDSEILVDQIRAIDNRRFIRQIGKLSPSDCWRLTENLRIVLFE